MLSITTWLEGHPEDLKAYTPLAETPADRPSTLKRKRKVLGEMSDNIEPEKRRSRSPRKRDPPATIKRTPRRAKRDILDIDATPKAKGGLGLMLPLALESGTSDSE